MTLAAGLTTSGFVAPTSTQILADLNAKTLSTIRADLDTAPDQPIGQIWGIAAEKFAEIYEVVSTIYNALNPNAADGQLLVNAAALTGTVPQAATYSQCVATLNINAGATVNAGAIAAVVNQPTNTWVLLASVTNSGGAAANLTGTFRSSLPGIFVAPPGTLIVIPVSTVGWNTVTNALSSTNGNAADTDATLRARRQAQLSGQGSGDLSAIVSAVSKVTGVLSNGVLGTENTSLLPAADGTPGKSFHIVVWDGPTLAATNVSIAQAIWNSKPSGIYSYGATTATATDSQGNTHSISFDRVTQQPIYLQFTTTPSVLTTSQTAAIKTAVIGYVNGTFDANGNELTLPAIGPGQSVVALALKAAALVPGVVTDVPSLTLNVGSYGGGTSNISISGTQIATFDVNHMTVNGI